MNFHLIGVNHNTAPLEVRERLTVNESQLADAVRSLVQHPGVEEGMVLSTCNRVEMLTSTRQGADLRAFLHGYFRVNPDSLNSHIYEFQERAAVRHVFRVASSLDSMVVGEPQILGQVKEAYAVARSQGAINSGLEALLSRAFAVAKRVRTETAIGSSSVSVASVAVDLAEKIFGSLRDKTVYMVGAGKMAELASRQLLSRGAGKILISNRTYDRAADLAEQLGGRAVPLDQLDQASESADIILTSTGAAEPLFRKSNAEVLSHRRRGRPVFFIDIAVPRNVAPEVNKLEGMFVYDIDDLQSIASRNTAEREKEAERAEKIVEIEVERFALRIKSLEVVPTILSLQEYCETIRQAEFDRIRGRLGSISLEQEAAIDAMTRGIINKLLHTPITTLKSSASRPEAQTIHEMIRRIFNLETRNLEARNLENRNYENKNLESGDSDQNLNSNRGKPER